jgi:fumarate reductase flavoprotein subunit
MPRLEKQAEDARRRAVALVRTEKGGERIAVLRDAMADSMEAGCGIFRTGAGMQQTCDTLAELKERYGRLSLDDTSAAWNTEWLSAIELGYQLDVAQAMAHSAFARKESRGSHARIDGFEQRDDVNFLKHTLAAYRADGPPLISYGAVKITKSVPGTRAYGAAGERAEQSRKTESQGAKP